MHRKNIKIILYIGFLAFFVAYSFSFVRQSYQGALPNYISAAKNIGTLTFCISQSEVNHFNKLSNSSEGVLNYDKRRYSFHSSECTSDSDVVARGVGYLISYGYLFLIYIIMFLFGWMGDVQSIIFVSTISHGFCSAWLFSMLKEKSSRIFFSIIYIFNPAVIWIICGGYYYSFLPLAGAIFYYLYLNLIKESSNYKNLLLGFFLLALLVVLRPTLSLLYCFAATLYVRKYKIRNLVGLLILLSAFLICYFVVITSHYGPWHTVLTGVDSYNWLNNIYLDDDNTVRRIANFLKLNHTNAPLVLQIGAEKYIEIAREIAIKFYAENPYILIRNFIFNLFGSFGFGYFNKYPILTITSTIFGGLVFLLMLLKNCKILSAAIFFSVISYIIYFPPILAYNLTGYVLTCVFLSVYVGQKMRVNE